MVRPVPIPNTAVKHCRADGSSLIDSARVGRRQSFNKNPERNLSGFFAYSSILTGRSSRPDVSVGREPNWESVDEKHRFQMRTATALITGAGIGIGLALAHEFARNGHHSILTSRIDDELRKIASQLTSRFDVNVGTIAADLENGAQVDILVNNAGLVFRGKSWEIPFENQLSIVRVNIEAIVRLTHRFLAEILTRNAADSEHCFHRGLRTRASAGCFSGQQSIRALF